jgi:hypothetical protein
MSVLTFIRIRNEQDVTHVVVFDTAGERVLPPTPLTAVQNLRYAFVPLPVDRGPLVAMFTSDPQGLNVVNECPVQEPRYEEPGVVLGAWLVGENLVGSV